MVLGPSHYGFLDERRAKAQFHRINYGRIVHEQPWGLASGVRHTRLNVDIEYWTDRQNRSVTGPFSIRATHTNYK